MTQQDSESIAPAGEVFISYSWDSEAHSATSPSGSRGKGGLHPSPRVSRIGFFFYADLANSRSLAITTVVQELRSLGKSRFAAMRISSRGRSLRMIGQ